MSRTDVPGSATLCHELRKQKEKYCLTNDRKIPSGRKLEAHFSFAWPAPRNTLVRQDPIATNTRLCLRIGMKVLLMRVLRVGGFTSAKSQMWPKCFSVFSKKYETLGHEAFLLCVFVLRTRENHKFDAPPFFLRFPLFSEGSRF